VNFFRVFIEKKQGFQNEALELLEDIRETLHLPTIQSIRLFNIYEMNGVDIESFETITRQVFSEINTDNIYHEIPVHQGTSISWEAVPGQFDQRSDSAAQCIHLIYPSWQGQLKSGRLLQINGELSHDQLISV
jgi:phosphoribosylformylglycinamidine synthase